MRPTFKRPFVASFAAFFGCISLLGQGLHSFVGHDFHAPHVDCHATACHPGDCHAEHADPDECDDAACHGAGAAARGERDHQPGQFVGVAPGGWSHDDHDCPICGFFAQTLRAFDGRAVVLETASTSLTLAAEQAAHVACFGIYRSRAPPAAGLIS